MENSINILLNRGKSLYNGKEYKKAIEIFNNVILIDELNIYAWFYKGLCLKMLEDKTAALESLEKAISINEIWANAWKYKGYILEDIGSKYLAVQAFDKALSLYTNSIPDLENKIEILLHCNKYDDALPLILEVIEHDPKKEEWIACANSYFDNEHFDETLQILSKAIELYPNNPEPWAFLGLVEARINNDDDALKAYNNALRIDIECKNAWEYKGVFLRRSGLYMEASLSVMCILSINQKDLLNAFMEGYCLDEHDMSPDDFLEEIDAYTKLLKDKKYNKGARLLLNSTLKALSNHREIRDIEDFNDVRLRIGNVYYQEAKAELGKGNVEMAIKLFERTIEFNKRKRMDILWLLNQNMLKNDRAFIDFITSVLKSNNRAL